MKKTEKGPLFFFCTFDYINSYLPNSGMSRYTILSYSMALTLFRKFAYSELKISCVDLKFSQCTREFLYSFMKWLEEKRGNCPSSRNLRLAEIKAYVEYAADIDISLIPILNEVMTVRPCQTESSIRETLSANNMEIIVRSTPNTKKGYRDKTIILFQYETACRISEVLSVTVNDLFLDAEVPFVKLHGKGKKERIVPLSDNMVYCLRNYLDTFHEGDNVQANTLFYSVRGGVFCKLDVRTVQIFLQKYADKARKIDNTIPQNVYTHMLRRSKATELYRSGMSLELVSGILGHEQIETTRVYAKASVEMMKSAIEKTSLKDYSDEKPEWLGKEDLLAKYFGI